MKQRSTTPVSRGFATKSALVAVAVLMAISVPLSSMPRAKADRFDDQINALKSEIDQYESQASKLNKQARTLQNEIAGLEQQKNIIQTQIDLSVAKYNKLTKQIKQTKQDIRDNQDALGTTIADLYVDDTISPLEMLASSKNIGDYVDKQTYRTTMQDELTSAIDRIEELKKKLDAQKVSVQRTLNDQKNARKALAAKEAEKQQVLAVTKGKEANFKKLSSQRDSEISELRRKQQEEVARRLAATAASSGSSSGYTAVPGSSANGGYPNVWANAPQNSMVDSWGMYNRQCTSYAAFMVDQAYGNMPYWGGIGNAWEWTRNAQNAGIPNGATPKPGSVGVLQDGGYGHVAWVHSVQADGTITIDHYNINWSGTYARWTGVSPNFFDNYIYFGEW